MEAEIVFGPLQGYGKWLCLGDTTLRSYKTRPNQVKQVKMRDACIVHKTESEFAQTKGGGQTEEGEFA